MQLKTSTVFWVFVWSIFMGITVGSIGIGAAYPPANLITAPFVCPNGQLQLSTQTYRPWPGETDTTMTWYCVDKATGAPQEVSIFKMALIAGPIYGLLLFVVIQAVMLYRARHPNPRKTWRSTDARRDATNAAMSSDPELQELVRLDSSFAAAGASSPHAGAGRAGSPEQRLAHLKSLRDSGLITEQDYAQKKSDILRDV